MGYKYLVMNLDGDAFLKPRRGQCFLHEGVSVMKPPSFIKPGQLWVDCTNEDDPGFASQWIDKAWRKVEDHSQTDEQKEGQDEL